MKIELTQPAVQWFKDEFDLPQDDKVLHFFVRYGGEFQLKQGFSPAFNVENKADVEGAYEEEFDGLTLVIAEKDLWYFEDDHIVVDAVDHEDEISYSKSNLKQPNNATKVSNVRLFSFSDANLITNDRYHLLLLHLYLLYLKLNFTIYFVPISKITIQSNRFKCISFHTNQFSVTCCS